MHYEGTPHDDEYVLGIRVMMHSVRQHSPGFPFLVLVSPEVRASSRGLFQRDGATVREVRSIANPFAHRVKPHFLNALNKLHLWNQTDFDRLIYLDADNIATGDLRPLFRCGHFCAVFMNPINFHTGLLVVRPDLEVFRDMLQRLGSGAAESYDGADQGFLTDYFPFDRMISSPMFSEALCPPPSERPFPSEAKRGPCDVEMMRIPISYNLNALWFYEKGSWSLFALRAGRTQVEANSTRGGTARHTHMRGADVGSAVHYETSNTGPPGYSLAFPVPTLIKPWYWWSYALMDENWVDWQRQRVMMEADTNGSVLGPSSTCMQALALVRMLVLCWLGAVLCRALVSWAVARAADVLVRRNHAEKHDGGTVGGAPAKGSDGSDGSDGCEGRQSESKHPVLTSRYRAGAGGGGSGYVGADRRNRAAGIAALRLPTPLALARAVVCGLACIGGSSYGALLLVPPTEAPAVGYAKFAAAQFMLFVVCADACAELFARCDLDRGRAAAAAAEGAAGAGAAGRGLRGLHVRLSALCRLASPCLAVMGLNAASTYWRLYPVLTVHFGRLLVFAFFFFSWIGLQLRLVVRVICRG
jgi:hypothetical protein